MEAKTHTALVAAATSAGSGPELARARIVRRIGWTAGAILALAQIVMLSALAPLPLQDFPAHLANATVMADLVFHGGARFGEMFTYRFLFAPYVLGDFAFAAIVAALGAQVGGALWLTVVLLSLPCALIFFMRASGAPADRRALVFILSLYLATDWFFLMGFLNFRLGLAITIVNFALVTLLRHRWSAAAFAGYAALVVVGYLVHLSTIAFLGPAVGVSGLLRLWRRTSSIRTEALLVAPIVAMLVWHFAVAAGYTLPGDPGENPYTWGLHEKLTWLDQEFIRFHMRADLPMLAALAACLLVSAGRVRWQHLRESATPEMLLLAMTFIALYVALPRGYPEAWYVDVRALALASVCVILAYANLPADSSWSRVPGPALALALAVPLVATNLVYLERHLARDQDELTQYRAIAAAIPAGSHVLPVITHAREGSIAPTRHADAFLIIDREALMPYAFTADTANPQKYLRYVYRPYIPAEDWYVRSPTPHVDWSQVARDYDYLLVEKPFDSRRVPMPMTVVAENGDAALLAIDKDGGVASASH